MVVFGRSSKCVCQRNNSTFVAVSLPLTICRGNFTAFVNTTGAKSNQTPKVRKLHLCAQLGNTLRETYAWHKGPKDVNPFAAC